MSESHAEKLMDDVRQVIAEVEELLRATAGQTGERIGEARSRAEKTLHRARDRLADLEGEAVDRARHAVKDADRYVRDNPWQSIGIAAGIAFVVGVLVGRR